MRPLGFTASKFNWRDVDVVDEEFDLNSPLPPSLPTKPVFQEIKPEFFIQKSFFSTFLWVFLISAIVVILFTERKEAILFALIGSSSFSLIRLYIKYLYATEEYENKVKHHNHSISVYEKQVVQYEQEKKQFELDLQEYQRKRKEEKERAEEDWKRKLSERNKPSQKVEKIPAKDTSSSNIISRAKEKLQQEVFAFEKRTDLTEDQKVKQLVTIFSTTCAAIAVQPIPFADIFVLTPIQGLMGKKMADIKGYSITEAGAISIFKEMASLVGLGLLAQQLVIGAYKTVIPFLGAITTIPLVFGLTYAMGYVMDYYFDKKIKNERIDPQVIKDIFKKARVEGKQKAKENKEEINRKKKVL